MVGENDQGKAADETVHGDKAVLQPAQFPFERAPSLFSWTERLAEAGDRLWSAVTSFPLGECTAPAVLAGVDVELQWPSAAGVLGCAVIRHVQCCRLRQRLLHVLERSQVEWVRRPIGPLDSLLCGALEALVKLCEARDKLPEEVCERSK